jgi:uncharacterized cupredoxin-like copper-binding protein
MRRKAFLAVVLASGVGLLAAGAVASSAIFSTHTANATVITVVAGKPSELRFQLSKSTKLKIGTYTFKVTNKGLGFHTFKLCTARVKTAAKNTCVGKVTKTLHPGQTASFTVKITKAGKYEYLCSIPGHAAGGMKGLIGVAVAVKPAPPPPTTTATTTTTPTTTGPPTANGCPYGTPPGTTIGSDEDGDESDAIGKDDADGCL